MDYKKLYEELQKKLGVGESDPTKDGYLVLVQLLTQQNEYLKAVNIKTLITDEAKGKTAEFERAKALWEKLPTMIENVTNLKYSLKIEDEKRVDTQQPISPQSIALNGRKNV